jgi:hypothetical protein
VPFGGDLTRSTIIRLAASAAALLLAGSSALLLKEPAPAAVHIGGPGRPVATPLAGAPR